MGEIKTSDLQEINTPEKKGFREIHSQEGMTPQEANKIWDNEVIGLKNQDTSSDVYTDDNGKEYKQFLCAEDVHCLSRTSMNS